MSKSTKPEISKSDIIKIVGGVASHFGNWYATNSIDFIERGLTDEELTEKLKLLVCIAGGAGGPDSIDHFFKRSGFRLWISWDVQNLYEEKPLIQGKAFVNLVREIYCVPDPSDPQLALL